ncbi:toprim domain-containing protein [Sulfurospirillum sp. T05]|uniref:Toprim domain-containing protein n=1 Tax=Sulfurospirillum tamanense TaxID=2813362 RepID=A0ABS2WUB7_9BACT|nr:toprim domain-containing protein [Sulfurospirillum tamanensis]MBN2965254.1 toprim domain-containing protein [Sulfurospirillum tamanensis]
MKAQNIMPNHRELHEGLQQTLLGLEQEFHAKIEHVPSAFIVTVNERTLKINYMEEQSNANYLDGRLRGILKTIQSQNAELEKQGAQISEEQRKSSAVVGRARTLNVERAAREPDGRTRELGGEDRELKRDNRQTQSATTYLNYPQIPMNELLQKLGYEVKREKSSANHMTMTNGVDTVVISRGHKDGNYLYYNVNETGDRGTIFNFCRNRDIDIHELVNRTNVQESQHKIGLTHQGYSPRTAQKYNELQPYNQSGLNSLETIRKIAKEVTDRFSSIKTDHHRNVIFPSYTMEAVSIEGEEQRKFITISGMNKKLLEKPLTHDKEGVAYKEPVNSLEEGKKGISILIADGVSEKDIKTVIVGENSIDNLSYAEMKGLDLSSSLFISFNGNMREDGKTTFLNVVSRLENVENVVKVFDNDPQGREFDKQVKDIFAVNALANHFEKVLESGLNIEEAKTSLLKNDADQLYLPSVQEAVTDMEHYNKLVQTAIRNHETEAFVKKEFPDLDFKVDKSELKDWNEDLKAHKTLNNGKLFENGLSLKENIASELEKKINLYHSYPDVPPERKSKLYNNIEQLAKWSTPTRKQSEQLERVREKQQGLERGGR